jgi:PAS domain S-box-containing protein
MSRTMSRPDTLSPLHPIETLPAELPASTVSADADSELALALELGHIAVWRVDIASQRVHPNGHAWAVLGLQPRDDGLSVAELRAMTHPDDLPRVVASTEAAIAGRTPATSEARFRRPDGVWRHVLMRRAVQRGPDGAPRVLIGVGMDITDRIEQRQRAEEMARRFELVTRTAGIGYWMLEKGAERAVWSDEMRTLFGLPAGAPVPLLDEWLASCVHPADRDDLRHGFAAWTAAGFAPVARAFRIVRPDGSVRHVMAHSRVETGNHAPMLFGVVIDLTDKRSAEQALRRANDRAALVAQGVGLGTWEQDLATGEAMWDAQMWRLRGHPPQPRAMTRPERAACVHPDDRAMVRRFNDLPVPDGATREFEFRVVWPDGSVRWLASRSIEISDTDSGRRRRVGVNWDVTDSRTAEAARAEREIALRESQAKSKFLARMSHELRTPLNAVLGFSQLLLAEDGGHDPAAALRRRRLEHIRAAGQHLLTLINDVLDLSSLEGGELRIALQPVPLAPLVEQTLPLLAPLLDRHQVALHVGDLACSAMADPTRLRQVLINLLSNAAKYNRPGGRVSLEALPRGEQVLLRVSDTGRGMSDEQLQHLFEPFNRLGQGSEGSGGVEGTGIGLAIVKALVEHMGGSVHVDSTPGVGSVFELRLKAAPAGAAHAAADAPPADAPEPPPPGPHGRVVLYIEDNPINAQIIAELVGRRGDITLQVAPDGAAGVAQALALGPDLILLDMQLPDFDGFEVMRRLRAQPATAGIPVIALSANAMPEDIKRALAAGMADYWTKPLDFKAFMVNLDRLFGAAEPLRPARAGLSS